MARVFSGLLFLSVGLYVAYGSVISYYCVTDGTVYVTNPNASIFCSVSASNNETACNVTMSADDTNITITGCAKMIGITITLSSRNETEAMNDGIVGGDAYTETYMIKCGEIPDEGIMFTRGLYVIVEAETVIGNVTQLAPSTELAVTPIWRVKTEICDLADTQIVTSGIVSEKLRWKITGSASEYDILPINCTAYSGTAIGGWPSQAIITNGCTEDSDLVGHFQSINSDQNELYAWFWVFKFYNAEEITIGCTVRTCTKGAASCNLACSKKKKRSYYEVENDYAANSNILETFVVAHLDVSLSAAADLGPKFPTLLLSVILGIYSYYL